MSKEQQTTVKHERLGPQRWSGKRSEHDFNPQRKPGVCAERCTQKFYQIDYPETK